jgi:hypothetical protein
VGLLSPLSLGMRRHVTREDETQPPHQALSLKGLTLTGAAEEPFAQFAAVRPLRQSEALRGVQRA